MSVFHTSRLGPIRKQPILEPNILESPAAMEEQQPQGSMLRPDAPSYQPMDAPRMRQDTGPEPLNSDPSGPRGSSHAAAGGTVMLKAAIARFSSAQPLGSRADMPGEHSNPCCPPIWVVGKCG